jgi:hypothetical protein
MRIQFLLFFPAFAFATTLIPHTLAERAKEADQVALVQVISSRIEKTDGAKFPKTVVHVLVGQRFKGQGDKELDIVQLGALDGLADSRVPGDAQFKLGETALVFLRCKTQANRCGLVAFSEGKIELNGEDARIHDLIENTWRIKKIGQLISELQLPEYRVAP